MNSGYPFSVRGILIGLSKNPFMQRIILYKISADILMESMQSATSGKTSGKISAKLNQVLRKGQRLQKEVWLAW